MSRTDKDRPYGVRVRDSLEHTHEQHHHVPTWRHTNAEGCDLDAWLAGNHQERDANGHRIYYSCYRAFDTTSDYYYGKGVPKWFIDHTWNNPQRVRVRDRLNLAKQWYNGGDDLEDFDYPNEQHRHRSSWYWW